MAAQSSITNDNGVLGQFLPEAYGIHLMRGIPAAHEIEVIGNQTTVKLKQLLGKGKWEELLKVIYDGVELASDAWEFFPGEAEPAADERFPGQLAHAGIARYSVTLPNGIAEDNDPSKLAALVKCKRVYQYDGDGNPSAEPVFSTNPADHFVDAIREDCLQKGIPLNDRVNWSNYLDAWFWFNEDLTYADYSKIPRNLSLTRVAGGSLPEATYAVSVQATNASGHFSQRTGEAVLPVSGSDLSLALSGDGTAEGATGYRLWLRDLTNAPEVFYYVDTETPNFTFTALPGDIGTPTAATGAFLVTRPRMESHCAFTTPSDLETVLNAICLQVGCDWQKAGKQYLLLLPHNRPVSHSFSEANTMPGTFRFWHTEDEQRITRLVVNFRETTDPKLRPAPELIVNRPLSEAATGIIAEPLQFWGMTRHQAMRVASLRLKQRHDRSLHCELEDDGSGAHLLPGDLVDISDAGAGWSAKVFVILEIERNDSDDGDRRKFLCREWSNDDYQDSDGELLPVTSVVPAPLPSRFAPPPAVSDVVLSTGYEVLTDGTVNGFITVGVQFAAHSQQMVGRLYQQRPGETEFTLIATLTPDASTLFSGYRVDLASAGTHTFKVVVATALGVLQAEAATEYSVEMPEYLVAPPRSSSFTGSRVNSVINWRWFPVPSRNVKSYRIVDAGSGETLAETAALAWDEQLPPAGTLTRRLYTVDTAGNVSTEYREATYSAEHSDQRTSFNVPIGSTNFVAAGNDASAAEEDGEFLVAVSGGSFDADTRSYRKTAADGYNAGVCFSRAIAYGDATLKLRSVPFAANAAAGLAFGWSVGSGATATAPVALSELNYGMQLETSAYSGTGASRIKIIEDGSVVATLAIPWVTGDEFYLAAEGTDILYFRNGVNIYTSSAIVPQVPLIPKALVYASGQTLQESSFSTSGWHQDASPAKLHWRNVVGVRMNADDDLVRTLNGSGWDQAGAFSLESFLSAGFVETDFNASAPFTATAIGLSREDVDQHYTSIEYSVLMVDPNISTMPTPGFFIVEAGSIVGSFVAAEAGDRVRIAVEGNVVRYYLNGIEVHESTAAPPSNARWHADCSIWNQGNVLETVRIGDIGARGRGWRVSPNGEAEFAKGVTVGGSRITAVQARSISAIAPSNRYRGNDLGTPLETRLTAEMFRLGSLRSFEEEVYTELILDLPESLLDDAYANFDSVKLARVKVYNVFGEIVAECEQSFSGRGKLIIGVHPRDWADPVEQAVFSIEFKNVYGWSRAVYWTNAASGASDLWGSGNWNYTENGSTTAPPWRLKTDFPRHLQVFATSNKTLKAAWTPPTTLSAGGSTNAQVMIRPYQKGKTRSAWQPAVIGLTALSDDAQTFSSYIVSGADVPLSQDTLYEVMVTGGAESMWSNIAVVRTLPAPLAAESRPSPRGLTFSFNTSGGIGVTLNWERGATDNDTVEVYADGVLLSTEGGSTTSKSISGLTPGSTYHFAVRNQWSSGTAYSDFSNAVEVLVPAEGLPTDADPTNLSLTLIGSGNSVQLTWQANAGDLAQVQRSYDGVGWVTLGTLGTGVTEYADFGVGYSTHVYYRVRNTNGGNSGWSNVADIWTSPDILPDPECVTPETMVWLADGSMKPAGAVKVGNVVLAVNPLTGERESGIIAEIVRGSSSALLIISTIDGEVLHCTPSHPLVTKLGDAMGTPACRLSLGDSLLLANGSNTTISAIERLSSSEGFPVLTFRLDSESRTFVAEGLVSHNLGYKRY